MTLDFTIHRFAFDPTSGTEQHAQTTFTFPTKVRNVLPAISSFSMGYTDGDHHVSRIKVETAVDINGNSVDLLVRTFLLRDASGNIDDRYDGFVDVQLLVDRD